MLIDNFIYAAKIARITSCNLFSFCFNSYETQELCFTGRSKLPGVYLKAFVTCHFTD